MKVHQTILHLTFAAILSLICATAIIGYAHTLSGRQTRVGKFVFSALTHFCPLQQVTAAQVDHRMQIELAPVRGKYKAPNRPALGFQLDQTNQAAVLHKMTAAGLHCEEKKMGYLLLRCERGQDEQTTFVFNGSGKLKSISVYQTGLKEDDAQKLWQAAAQALQQKLGLPTQRVGASGLPAKNRVLDLHSDKYRFQDYYAEMTILKEDGGRAFYQRYQSY